jgi:Bacteriophage minor capsid protein
MVLDEVGAYLQAQGLGVLGTDLFLGKMPQDAPNVVTQDAITALIEIPGFPMMFVHSTLGADWEQPVLQIITRGAPDDYAATRLWAEQITLALSQIRNQTLSGTFYLWCQPVQSVFALDPDDFGRPRMTCQVRLGKALSAS